MIVVGLFKVLISSFPVSHRENTSSMYRFHTNGFLVQWFIISVSIFAIKMLAKETAIFVPIAVP